MTNTQRVDVAELQRAIEQAEHKPGEWHVSAFTFGAAAIREAADVPSGFQPFNETIIGNFPWKRDGWLAVAAVNALPALLLQVAEQAAEIDLLRARETDLQNALHRWLPHITPSSPDIQSDDAYLLIGLIDPVGPEIGESIRQRAEAAERAREEACGLLKRCEAALRIGECDMHYHDKQGVRRSLQQTVAAFLAASGGKDHA